MNNFKKDYKEKILSLLQKDLNIKNNMAVPKLTKITVNMGVKDAIADKKNMDIAAAVFSQITGQKPKVTAARKSISGFKLREGEKIGLVVTLRGERMYDFFQKLVTIVLPRIKDFRGVKKKSFDTRGNYTIGLSENSVFPEVDLGKVEKVFGLEITIGTSAVNSKAAFALLKAFGMPFQK